MKIAYFYLTDDGYKLATKLRDILGGVIFDKGSFKASIKAAFYEYDNLVCIMATGIVIRTIAPLLDNKTKDPAVVVIDQKGQFAISLLSGHLGGANALAKKIENAIGAVAVITTATDVAGVCAFDLFAKKHGAFIENIDKLKYISGDIVNGKNIDLITDLPVSGDFGENVSIVDKYRGNNSVVFSAGLLIEADTHILYIRPKCMVVGIGCKRDTNSEYLEECFLDFIKCQKISIHSIKALSTIALKKEEEAILNLSKKYNIPIVIASEHEINQCEDLFDKSDYVKSVTGVYSVAEGSSYIASNKGSIICKKTKYKGLTFALSREDKVYEFTCGECQP